MYKHTLPGSLPWVCVGRAEAESHSPQKRAHKLQQLRAGHQLLVEERNAAQKVLVHLLALQHPAHLWEYGESEARDTIAEAVRTFVCTTNAMCACGAWMFGRAQ